MTTEQNREQAALCIMTQLTGDSFWWDWSGWLLQICENNDAATWLACADWLRDHGKEEYAKDYEARGRELQREGK